MTDTIAFIGGGNMASAILGGLVAAGHSRSGLLVVEPMPAQRALLEERFGIHAFVEAGAALSDARLVVWAVKPQLFAAAVAPCRPYVGHALQVSVMAGIRSDALVAATGSERVVRTMPNTPALVGAGIAALFARDAVSATERAEVESLLAPTGQTVWVGGEEQLDAVTAISGSGPAYVFHLIEAMLAAAREAGLPEATARRLDTDIRLDQPPTHTTPQTLPAADPAVPGPGWWSGSRGRSRADDFRSARRSRIPARRSRGRCPGRSPGHLGEDILGDLEVGGHALDVVEVLEELHEAQRLASLR